MSVSVVARAVSEYFRSADGIAPVHPVSLEIDQYLNRGASAGSRLVQHPPTE